MGNIRFQYPLRDIDSPGKGIPYEMHRAPGSDSHIFRGGGKPDVFGPGFLRRVILILKGNIQEDLHPPDQPVNADGRSTCKEIREIDQVNEELDKPYYLVVLDYNFNNRFEELQKIRDKGRCEILVNAVCSPDCPRRGKHYENVAKNQRIMLKNRKMPPDRQIPLESWHCEYGENNCIYTIQEYNTYVAPEDIWEKYVPMGFRHFKIEGRTANLFSLVETYCHFLIRPEYQGVARLQFLNNLVANRVLTINRPRPAKWPK